MYSKYEKYVFNVLENPKIGSEKIKNILANTINEQCFRETNRKGDEKSILESNKKRYKKRAPKVRPPSETYL
jgi:hypothetical protein